MPRVPERYLPRGLSRRDRGRQVRGLVASRRAYLRGKYLARPQLASFRSHPSGHVERAMKQYGVSTVAPSAALARATGCSPVALQQIVRKGQGAYYSSGSRPNQTAHSWGIARLASAITGGPASLVDRAILERGCRATGRARRLALRPNHHLRKPRTVRLKIT